MDSVAPVRAPLSPELQRIVHWFEHIQRADVARLGDIYGNDAYFKDPFNEVRGLDAVQRIFDHMFDQLDAPHFAVLDVVQHANQAFLTWDFTFRLKGAGKPQPMTIRGATHLRLDGDGRIAWHRDYWDAAEELYEKLPLLGTLMRWLKKRAQH